MKSNKQTKREAKDLFRCCVVNGLVDRDRALLAVKRVLESKPRGYMGILAHFQRLIKLDQDRRTAKVESATLLGADLQTGIQAGLGRIYGQGLDISFAQNAALIGGLRIKVGSDVYDGSVQSRLEQLQQSF
jgi:F-type H+-transporting ATPase subunit delta